MTLTMIGVVAGAADLETALKRSPDGQRSLGRNSSENGNADLAVSAQP